MKKIWTPLALGLCLFGAGTSRAGETNGTPGEPTDGERCAEAVDRVPTAPPAASDVDRGTAADRRGTEIDRGSSKDGGGRGFFEGGGGGDRGSSAP